MIYPKTENSVFYNPVQVQNRDLSILMITLYAERRARRLFLQEKRKKDKLSVAEAEEAASKIDWSAYVREKQNEDCKNGLRILDALAASGLRSIRYHKEIPGVREVIINDMEQAAVDLAKENLKFNRVPENEHNDGPISIQRGDATALMYQSRQTPFDVIDLDPYGSAAPFLDAAMQAIAHGGMLCVTCTDMVALGGSNPTACFGRYGAMPIQRAGYLQELALRILLQSLHRTANVYGRTIRPILSVGMAFYVRVFVEVYDDKAAVNTASTKIGHVYQSTQCDSFYLVPSGIFNGRNYQPGRTATHSSMKEEDRLSKKKKQKQKNGNKQEQANLTKQNGPIFAPIPNPFQCPETQSPFKIGGPIWFDRLHDYDTVEAAVALLETYAKNKANKSDTTDNTNNTSNSHYPTPIFQTHTPMHGLLTSVSEELPDQPLYYTMPGLSHTLHCSAPGQTPLYAAIRNAGYQVSSYHKEPNAIKTDAPPDVIWDIMRAWCRDHPVSKKWTDPNYYGGKEKRKGNDSSPTNDTKGEGDNGSGGGSTVNTDQNLSAAAKILNRGMVMLKLKEDTKDNNCSNTDDNDTNINADVLDPKVVDFTVRTKVPRKKAQRFPMNPQKHWGPKPRAVSSRKRPSPDQGQDEGSGDTNSTEQQQPPLKKKAEETGEKTL